MAKQQQHRIRNWVEYNKALVKRGSLTVWFNQDTIASWFNVSVDKKRGRPTRYSDLAIEFCLTIKALFKLPLRAAQGFVTSIFQLMKLSLPVPDYTSLDLLRKLKINQFNK